MQTSQASFTAISRDLKIVDSNSFQNQPDEELLKQRRPHPSRIQEFALSTGLATMNIDNETRTSTVAYMLAVLLIAVVIGSYFYGMSVGQVEGIKTGMYEAQRLQEAETNKEILKKLSAIEKVQVYAAGAGTSHESEKPKEGK